MAILIIAMRPIPQGDFMQNLGAIPRASTVGFRYEISGSVAKKKMRVERSNIDKAKVLSILGNDAKEFVGSGYKDTRSFLTNNGFARYNGDVNEFLAAIENRKRLDLLLVIAIGKIYNNLKCNFKEPDLANLAFFSRLEAFATQMERLTGKKVSIAVAVENTFFDKHVLRVNKPSFTRMTLEMSRKLAKDLGLAHLSIYPIDKFLAGKRYERDFYDSVSELNKRRSSLKKQSEFKTFYKVFYESYPTKTFNEAIRLYTSAAGRRRVGAWATDSTIRYIAFFRARDKMDFWGTNGSYIRTSVSPRSNVLQFEYGIGRMSPLHGMGTYGNGAIGTERFYDVVKALPEKGRLRMWYYGNKPFCAYISGIKLRGRSQSGQSR